MRHLPELLGGRNAEKIGIVEKSELLPLEVKLSTNIRGRYDSQVSSRPKYKKTRFFHGVPCSKHSKTNLDSWLKENTTTKKEGASSARVSTT